MTSGLTFDDLLVADRVSSGVASVTAAVVRDGSLVWSGATGSADGADGDATVDTQYRIGSITKTITAVEIMRLRDEGRLDLADPIGRHLPDVPFGHVTVAQLLTHTSGLQAETNGPWWERVPGGDWAALVASGPALVHKPGTRFHYSNVGFAVLGRLVEVIRGASWFEVVRTEILDPLGMRRTTYRPAGAAATGLSHDPLTDRVWHEPEHDAGAMAPAGQLWSSIEDLSRWAAFAGGYTGGVIAESTWREMTIPLAVDDRPGKDWGTAQALGWRIWEGDGHGRLVGHGGSMPGFLAVAFAEPRTGLGVAVLTNDTFRSGDLDDELLAAARRQWPRAVQPVPVEAPDDVTALVGDWYWGPVPYRLTPTADGFHLTDVNGNRRSDFVRDGDAWRGLDTYFAGERLVVQADGSLNLASFILSRTPYDPAVAHPGGVPRSP